MSASVVSRKFQENLAKISQIARQRAIARLERFGIYVLSQATERAPIQTGDLRASADDLPAEIDGDKLTKVIGFGMHYAAAVHEDLEAKHEQGQAKYLESVVRENEAKLSSELADSIREGER